MFEVALGFILGLSGWVPIPKEILQWYLWIQLIPEVYDLEASTLKMNFYGT